MGALWVRVAPGRIAIDRRGHEQPFRPVDDPGPGLSNPDCRGMLVGPTAEGWASTHPYGHRSHEYPSPRNAYDKDNGNDGPTQPRNLYPQP